MKRIFLTGAIVLFAAIAATNGSLSSISAQEILPLPSPKAEDGGHSEVIIDQEIVLDGQSGFSSYGQTEGQQETARERITRLAREKGDQRRARLARQKELGVSLSRPVVDVFGPQSSYMPLWYGGPVHIGPYYWNNDAYRSWPRGNYYGYPRF